MNKNPLVDVTAILMCAALIVLIGQYYIHKKQAEVFQVPQKHVEVKTFESLNKRTE